MLGKRGRPLRVFMGNSGYVRFTTYEAGRWQQVSVHVMVCLAFNGPRPTEAHHAAHADGDRWNNAAGNLAWKLPAENEADKVDHDTRAWGERHGMHVLTEEQVREIRSSPLPGVRLAERYGVTQTTISDIRNRKTWRHV